MSFGVFGNRFKRNSTVPDIESAGCRRNDRGLLYAAQPVVTELPMDKNDSTVKHKPSTVKPQKNLHPS